MLKFEYNVHARSIISTYDICFIYFLIGYYTICPNKIEKLKILILTNCCENIHA